TSLLLSLLVLLSMNNPARAAIYTLSLHDALPICKPSHGGGSRRCRASRRAEGPGHRGLRDAGCGWCPAAASLERRAEGTCCQGQDRKSTRLNSSHLGISYAVFCLKKKITYAWP